jgi:hypothetical protein
MKTFTHQKSWRGAVLGAVIVAAMTGWPVDRWDEAVAAAAAGLDGQARVILVPAGATSREIQLALDRLPASGGTVRLAPGTYEITQPVVLHRDGQTLRGAGETTVLHLAPEANCPVLILGEAVNHPLHVVQHLAVADLLIDGNRAQQSRELWREAGEGSEIRNNGITIQSVADSSVDHVTCARCRSGGLVTTLGVRHLTVTRLEAYGNQFDGLACYLTTDSVFANLFLHDNPGAGISLDLAFDQNVIRDAVLARNDLGIFMRASRSNQFHNVTISNSHHFGVFMAQADFRTPAGIRGVPDTECTRNAFTNLAAVDCGSAAFRVNDLTCTNNIIIQPRFDHDAFGTLSEAQPNLVVVQ